MNDNLPAVAQMVAEGPLLKRIAELEDALKGLSDMYALTWDLADGGLTMMASGVKKFEAAHAKARAILNKDQSHADAR